MALRDHFRPPLSTRAPLAQDIEQSPDEYSTMGL